VSLRLHNLFGAILAQIPANLGNWSSVVFTICCERHGLIVLFGLAQPILVFKYFEKLKNNDAAHVAVCK